MKEVRQRKPHGESAYEETFRRAGDRLRGLDLQEVCSRCNVRPAGGGLAFDYFSTRVELELPGIVFSPDRLPLYEQILLLHYLIGTGGSAGSGEYVPFKNLPGAYFYDAAYRRRTVQRLIDCFGDRPLELLEAGARLGGVPASYGDASIRITVLPRIDTIVAVYRGDEEFPPEAAILYPQHVVDYLPLEDVAVLGGLIAGRLGKALP